MNLLQDSECIHDMYFYPNYDHLFWDRKWIDELANEVDPIFEEVRSYVAIIEKPPLFFLQEHIAGYCREQLKLAPWVTAFTYKYSVYIFFNHTKSDWRNLIAHEMFHAGVNQVCRGNIIIPHWFNESIAYFIGSDQSPQINLFDFVTEKKDRIMDALKEDRLFEKFDNDSFHLAMSLGTFFISTYGSFGVRSLISAAASKSSFYDALEEDLPDLINHWCKWLFYTERKNKVNFPAGSTLEDLLNRNCIDFADRRK